MSPSVRRPPRAGSGACAACERRPPARGTLGSERGGESRKDVSDLAAWFGNGRMHGSSALGIAGRWRHLRGAVYLQFLMFSADMVVSNVSGWKGYGDDV